MSQINHVQPGTTYQSFDPHVHAQPLPQSAQTGRLVEDALRRASANFSEIDTAHRRLINESTAGGRLPPEMIRSVLIPPSERLLTRLIPREEWIDNLTLPVWGNVDLLTECRCHKVEKILANVLKAAAVATTAAFVASVVLYAFLPLSLIGVAATVSAVGLVAIGGIAVFDLVRRKRIFPAAAQKSMGNIHALIVRSFCTLATAVQERNRHVKEIFQPQNHSFRVR